MKPVSNSTIVLNGHLFLALSYAKHYLLGIFKDNYKKEWPLENYQIWIEEHDEYVMVSFIPDTEQEEWSYGMEIPFRGVWSNGPGIEMKISLADFSLLSFHGMR